MSSWRDGGGGSRGQSPDKDVVLAILFDADNRRRIVEALAPLNPRPQRIAPGAAWVWGEMSIRPPWSIYETDAGRIDLIIRLPGVDSFTGLFERSELLDLGDMSLRVASIDDLIAMKRTADRDIDRNDVEILLAIQQLQREMA